MKEIDKITIRLEKLFNDLGMPELYAWHHELRRNHRFTGEKH